MGWAHQPTKTVWPEGLSCRIQILRCYRGKNFPVLPAEERIFYATTQNSNCSYKVYTVFVGPHWGFNKTNGKAPTDRVWPTATSALEVILHYMEKEENFQPIKLWSKQLFLFMAKEWLVSCKQHAKISKRLDYWIVLWSFSERSHKWLSKLTPCASALLKYMEKCGAGFPKALSTPLEIHIEPGA